MALSPEFHFLSLEAIILNGLSTFGDVKYNIIFHLND